MTIQVSVLVLDKTWSGPLLFHKIHDLNTAMSAAVAQFIVTWMCFHAPKYRTASTNYVACKFVSVEITFLALSTVLVLGFFLILKFWHFLNKLVLMPNSHSSENIATV